MTSVFIGGSRRLSRLNPDIRTRLDKIIDRKLHVLLGDANGADKAVQAYFKERSYPNVSVFCTAGQCRNNLGNWPVQPITAPHKTRDFEFFAAKDAAMAREADAGLMIWDGESAGTIVNVARLIDRGKPVVLYISPSKSFQTVRSTSELDKILLHCPAEVRDRIGRYVSDHTKESVRPGLF